MNHDATHCADYKKSTCPKTCYRAQLTEDVREKLVELLCKMISPTITTGEQADFLIANGVTVQEWISVKDRLPEFCVAVLACAKYYVSVRYEPTVVRWTGDYWCDATGIRMQVTHWMPLPEPPKGE